MEITSPEFSDYEKIPQKFTCQGENTNPKLVFRDIPKGTKSLVLHIDDPDSPSGAFTHWLVINISPETTEIEENSVPKGATEGKNSAGQIGYMGPCPMHGEHRYIFNLYALNTVLNLHHSPDLEDLETQIRAHLIGRCQLTGLYQKN